MKIKNFYSKSKIWLLLFSFLLNVFVPASLIASRLRTGGQLSSAVVSQPGSTNGNRSKFRKSGFKRTDFQSQEKEGLLNASINSHADADVSVAEKQEQENKNISKMSEDKVKTEKQAAKSDNSSGQESVIKNKSAGGQENIDKQISENKSEIKISQDGKDPVQEFKKEVDLEPKGQEKQEKAKNNNSNVKPDQEVKNSGDGDFIKNFDLATEKSKQEELSLKRQERKERLAVEAKKAEDEESVIFNFEEVGLANIAAYVETLFNVKFISDDILTSPSKETKGLSGNTVSFKTQKPLTKKQAWNLFVEFLSMAGLSLVPQADKKFYRITSVQDAKKAAIPVFINHDPDKLPESGLIRYGYFLKDCSLGTILSVINSMRNQASSELIELNDHNAFILTDNAHNVKILMKIVKELDTVTMPQTLSVMRLYKSDVQDATDLYEKLTKESESSIVSARLFGPKAQSKALYFPKKIKIIGDRRTNSLIILGTTEAVKTVEDFVRKYVDVDIDTPYSPLYVYELKYAKANDVANIMNKLVQFGSEKQGSVRAGDKYFKNISFTAENEGNRVIIKGDYDDYLKVKEIIDQIDEQPKQVSIEMLILGIEIQDQKDIGSQIRNKFISPAGSQLSAQNSGVYMGSSSGSPIVLNKCTDKEGGLFGGNLALLGDIISIVAGAASGATALSFGSDKFGVWGIFGIFDKITNTQVVANPFLTVTNNTTAKVMVGETIRIVGANVIGTNEANSYTNFSANIDVEVTPKINSDGMIVAEISVGFDNFLSDLSKAERKVNTSVVLSNNEVLALGGLIQDDLRDAMSRVPVLGDIPILGWLFKNKRKTKKKGDLLILMTAHIVDPKEEIKENTVRHMKSYRQAIKEFDVVKTTRDPVDKSFFGDDPASIAIDDYIFSRGKGDEYTKVWTPKELRKGDISLAENKLEPKKKSKKEKRRGKKRLGRGSSSASGVGGNDPGKPFSA